MENNCFNVDIAIINAGGKGSRFSPFTNTLPKEMLPLNGIPAIEYAIDECTTANINKIIIATRQNNDTIKNHLISREKYKQYVCDCFNEDFNDLKIKQIVVIDGCIPGLYGNATSILKLRDYLNGKTFAVLFGDDIIYGKNSIVELQEMYYSSNADSIIACKQVDVREIINYGNLLINNHGRVIEFRQKPKKIDDILSNLAVVSRLILNGNIFNYITVEDGEEVDLGKALNEQASYRNVYAKEISGNWFTIDSPERYLNAQNALIADTKNNIT